VLVEAMAPAAALQAEAAGAVAGHPGPEVGLTVKQQKLQKKQQKLQQQWQDILGLRQAALHIMRVQRCLHAGNGVTLLCLALLSC
jgi:hypothetical protein